MAKSCYLYKDANSNLLFNAVIKVVADNALQVKHADRRAGVVVCVSKWSMKSFGQEISISIYEDQGCFLNIETKSSQIYDWGEGREIIQRLKFAIDEKLNYLNKMVSGPNVSHGVLAENSSALASSYEAGVEFNKNSRNLLFLISVLSFVVAAILNGTGKNDAAVFWVAGIGVAGFCGWYVWGFFIPLQCIRCGKHTVVCLKTTESLMGVRSEQRSVVNLETRKSEWARVTVSDIERSTVYQCRSCKHRWTERYIYTNDGN